MLQREDVERIIENTLRELSVEVKPSGFPNTRIIRLKYKDRILSERDFDLVQRPGNEE